MIFGRQNNLTRRAVRPDGQFTRQLRRKKADRVSLLDITSGGPPKPSALSRLVNAIIRKIIR